jgi:predicted nuclease with RNAse H fold
MSEEQTYIGVNPTGSERSVAYAVLDDDLHVLKAENARLEAVIEQIDGYSHVFCAIAAPMEANKGLLADPDYRSRVGLPPDTKTYVNYRMCEYELRRRGISVRGTPQDAERAPAWIRIGWKLYEALRAGGFVAHPRPGPRQMCEVNAKGSFTVLIGKRPYPRRSVEGRLQRQLVLYEEGLDFSDPMGLLEEFTRHRLLTGEVNVSELHGHILLDALVGAYTAFLLKREPQHTSFVGDPIEGTIALPSEEIKESYR